MCLVESVCPECEVPVDSQVPRRGFLQAMGAGAAVALAGSAAARSAVAFDEKAPAKRGPEKPAEALIKELHASLSDEQKKTLVLPYNHGKGKLSRHGMFNRPFQQQRIGDVYSKPQQELVDRILHAICNGEEGYRQITRAGKFDSSKSLQGCGAHIFGTPGDDTKFTWMFTGHHLTVRCDGNTEPGAAFGGPMYYGHSARGDSTGNVYHFQTRRVQELFESLDEEQQAQAINKEKHSEGAGSVKFRAADKPLPGIAAGSLSADQKDLVERVMKDLVAPFRKEDGDEVMDIVKKNGGLDKIHLAYHKDKSSKEDNIRWHAWRVEGPGFVWNFRVLPHVHCFVNISSEFKNA